MARLTVFENHRKDKIPVSDLISVITEIGTVESGWTNGRDLDQISEDFGELNKDWFFFQHKAAAYVIKNGLNRK